MRREDVPQQISRNWECCVAGEDCGQSVGGVKLLRAQQVQCQFNGVSRDVGEEARSNVAALAAGISSLLSAWPF